MWFIGPPYSSPLFPEDLPHDTEFQEVVAALTIDVPGMAANDLGSLMPDYLMGVDLESMFEAEKV